MTFDLRAASPGDADAIATILSDWIDATPWMPRVHTRDEDRGFGAFLIARTGVRVAENKDILGFLAARDGAIEALYVAKNARGTGVGTALLNDAKARSGQLDLWVFQANEAARGFYARRGFHEDRMTDGSGNDEKLPDVHMTWNKKNQ